MPVDNRMILLANQSTDNASTNATSLYDSGGDDALLCGELAINTNTGVLFAGADPEGTGNGATATAVGAKIANASDVLALTLSTAATTQAVGTGASPSFAGITTNALTAGANLDIGAYTITGTQFISDIAVGTAPLVVTSTTMIDNLNADMLDGVEATGFVAVGGDDMTGPLVLDDTSLKFEEADDTLTITAPTLTADRAWVFPDGGGTFADAGDLLSLIDSDTFTGASSTNVASAESIKAYVDATAQGLTVKDSVVCASTANIATLTSGADAGAEIDGVTLAAGDRILLKNQTSGALNGIYTVGADGVAPTRATDFDADADVVNGSFVFVQEGTDQADSGWVMTNDEVVDVGTTALTWAQFSGAGQITAGSGLTKDGNELDLTDIATGGVLGNTSGNDAAPSRVATPMITVITAADATAARTVLGCGTGDGDMSDLTDDQSPQLYEAAILDTNSGGISFDDNHGIQDDDGNELLWFQKTGSAVNFAEITNSATTNGVTIGATGSDNDVDLLLTAKGSGVVKVDGNSLALGGSLTTLGAWTQTGAHTIGITTTGNTAITLPTSGTIVTTAAAQTLTSKTLSGGTF